MQLHRTGGGGDVTGVVVVAEEMGNAVEPIAGSCLDVAAGYRKIIQIEFSIAPNSSGTARSWSAAQTPLSHCRKGQGERRGEGS